MKTHRILVALIGMFALSAGLLAKGFEGKVRQQMTTPENTRGSVFINYLIKENFLRMEMEVDPTKPNKIMATIVDVTKRQIYILMPDQKMYMVKAMPEPSKTEPAGTPAQQAELIRTGETDTILGYKCEKLIAKNKDGITEIWGAEGIGYFMGASANPMGRAAPRNSWEAGLSKNGFFPLRVVSKDTSGKERMRMETVAIEPKSFPDSTFVPPEDYKKFEMPSIPGLGGLLGGKGN
jgi:hypothetical protein